MPTKKKPPTEKLLLLAETPMTPEQLVAKCHQLDADKALLRSELIAMTHRALTAEHREAFWKKYLADAVKDGADAEAELDTLDPHSPEERQFWGEPS